MIDAIRHAGGLAGVLYYRLYFLDRFSGHIEQCREFEARDDEAALATAEGWRTGQPMELWNRHRKLKHWAEKPMLSD